MIKVNEEPLKPTTEVTDVEVSHEVLIRQWGRLRDWLDELRRTGQIVEQVRSETKRYIESGKEEHNLTLHGSRLLHAISILSKNPPKLSSSKA